MFMMYMTAQENGAVELMASLTSLKSILKQV